MVSATGQAQPWDDAFSGVGWEAPGIVAFLRTDSDLAPRREISAEKVDEVVETWRVSFSPGE